MGGEDDRDDRDDGRRRLLPRYEVLDQASVLGDRDLTWLLEEIRSRRFSSDSTCRLWPPRLKSAVEAELDEELQEAARKDRASSGGGVKLLFECCQGGREAEGSIEEVSTVRAGTPGPTESPRQDDPRSGSIDDPTLEEVAATAERAQSQMAEATPTELRQRIWDRSVRIHGEPTAILPQIQFLSPFYFAQEGESRVTLSLIRIGDRSGRSSVKYETRDASAVAGKKYVHAEGTIEFAQGEDMNTIEVQILDDSDWSATLEFGVALKEPVHADLGRYNQSCRVKIIDNDYFPTNKLAPELMCGRMDHVQNRLLLEYFKMNFKNTVIRWGTVRVILVDSIQNIYIVVLIFLRVLLVDWVLATDKDVGRDEAAGLLITILMIQVIPYPFFHLMDFSKVYWKIGGTSRQILLSNLLRKFLYYDEESRAMLDYSDLSLAMTRDVPLLVEDGYMNVITFIRLMSRLVVVFLYQIFSPFFLEWLDIGDGEISFYVLIPTFIFPVLFFFFLLFRNPQTVRLMDTEKRTQSVLINSMDHSVRHFRIIRDYHKRSKTIDAHEAHIVKWNKARVDSDASETNNLYFAPWLGLIILVCYTFYGGLKVKEGQVDKQENPEDTGVTLTLGRFLTDLTIFHTIATAWGDIYTLLLVMRSTLPALMNVATLLNLPGEDVQLRVIVQTHEKSTREFLRLARRREQAKIAVSAPEKRETELHRHCYLAIDELDIVLMNLGYRHKQYGSIQGSVRNVSMSFQQGGLFALVGDRAAGKSTLMRILGGQILPVKTKDVAAPHMREGLRSHTFKPGEVEASARTDSRGTDPVESEQAQDENSDFEGTLVGTPSVRTMQVRNSVMGQGAARDELDMEGFFFIPAHLHILHVGHEPVFFMSTLLENLTYGVPAGDGDADLERVLQVCEKLGIHSDILEAISQGLVLNWDETLAMSQKALIGLARALIMNPEVLILHKPGLYLDVTETLTMMKVLREFVELRGVVKSKDRFWYRRPRTCIITSTTPAGLNKTDAVYKITKHGCQHLTAHNISITDYHKLGTGQGIK